MDFRAGTSEGTNATEEGALSLASFEGMNLALGAKATSGNKSLKGSSNVTDGSVDTEWRFDNKADVLGRWVMVDLGGNRSVLRVRILPGKLIEQRPEFFLKGYRIEVATEESPKDWRKVAESVANSAKVVDTTEDGTWFEKDANGAPLPAVGRYVRVVVTREDPPNWVVIGEIEVYGTGFRAEGTFTSETYGTGKLTNFGRARWDAETPENTTLSFQFRTSRDGIEWKPWEDLEQHVREDVQYDTTPGVEGVLFRCIEPAGYIQYRAMMRTYDPLKTPLLRVVEIDFDRSIVATRALASVSPDTVQVGRRSFLTYALDLEVNADDAGVDQILLDASGDVSLVRFNGEEIPADEEGYRVVPVPSPLRTDRPRIGVRLAPLWSIRSSGTLEIFFWTVLFSDANVIRSSVGNTEVSSPYENPQQAVPRSEGSWSVITTGVLGGVIPRDRIRVTPNPFHPPLDDITTIVFDVVNLDEPKPISVGIYDPTGRRVRRLWDQEFVTAGVKEATWDGVDDDGDRVGPGLYVFLIELESDVPAVVGGMVTVAY